MATQAWLSTTPLQQSTAMRYGKFGRKKGAERRRRYAHHSFQALINPACNAVFLAAWALTWWVLVTYTNSTVPVTDAFTNALSFVGLWALSRKYIEQWLFWIAVDAVCAYLYIGKGIPFKASLYALYVVIAVMGYFKWKRMMQKQSQPA